MALKTRKPTGKAPWPFLLLAGGEKCGKSWTAAAFSGSDLIDRTFWIEVGEGAADQYGTLGRYEIVEHDGSYQSILQACKDAVAEPSNPARPNCIVLDSATELWDMLGNEQADIAAKRGKKTITMDQWNAAKRDWRRIIDVLRRHNGPVLITARYEQVTVMDKNGRPTTEKEWKIRAEKNTGFEVDGIIEIPKARTFYLNGMRSTKMSVPSGGHMPLPEDFTLDWFMRQLDIQGGDRNYVAPQPQGERFEEPAELPIEGAGA